MKKWTLTLLFLGVAMVLGVSTQAFAQTRSSNYIESYLVQAYQGDNRGEVYIDFYVKANSTTPKIGVLEIEIYQSNGNYVTTIKGSTVNRLLSPKSTGFYSFSYHYIGLPGISYHAKVTLCAGTASDYDTRLVRTQTVKAPT